MPYRVLRKRRARFDTITVDQLSELLQVKKTKAYEIMQSILSVSNTLCIKGMCHVQDYEEWKKARKGKVKNIFYKEN